MEISAPGIVTDLALLRLQGSVVTDRGDHLVVRTAANPTFWWGNFVLVAGPPRADEVDRWLGIFQHEHPSAGHAAIAFTELPATSDEAEQAWQQRGFDVEIDVDLATTTVPLPADEPDGIRLRPLESDDDWEQSALVGGSDTSPDGRDDRLLFERRRAAAQRSLVESGRARWFGAFDGDQLVANLGIVRLGALARYQDVVTLATHRRRGLAGALVRTAGEWAMAEPTVSRLVIVAEEGGPAIGLYGRAGFAEVARHVAVSRAPGEADAAARGCDVPTRRGRRVEWALSTAGRGSSRRGGLVSRGALRRSPTGGSARSPRSCRWHRSRRRSAPTGRPAPPAAGSARPGR